MRRLMQSHMRTVTAAPQPSFLNSDRPETVGGSASQRCLIKHSSSVDSMQPVNYSAPMPSIKSLPEFDAAPTLDSEAAVAAYLTDILEGSDQ